jgi:hypothetical protein
MIEYIYGIMLLKSSYLSSITTWGKIEISLEF